jgi:prepilin-type N-terminal cleavage/methylation domain-containing protein
MPSGAKRDSRAGPASRGFSLVELLIAFAVLLTLAAVATPAVMQSWQSYRLSSAAGNVASLLARTRYEAIRQNTTLNCSLTQQGSNQGLWIDLNKNGAADPGEPIVLLPADVQPVGPGVAPSPDSMNYPNVETLTGSVAFNARGVVDDGGSPPVVYALYLGIAGAPQYGYRAITVTPMGQVKVWSAVADGAWHSP